MGGMNVYDELIRAQLESLSADPTAGPIARVIWNSTEGRAKYDTGAAFRAFLANDEACVIGNNATAANNVRLHRGASAVLQFALGNDVTADGSLTVNLAQISAKVEGYATGSLPAAAAGTEGRLLFDTTLHTFGWDNGTALKTAVDTNSAQTLTNKTLTNPAISSGVDWAQISTPSAPAASTYRTYFKSDGKLYKLDSSSIETEVVGSSSGGVNYILNPDAESSVTGWVAYADAAAATPVDGTGGSPNTTITRTTSSPLRGQGSFLITKSSGTSRQGEGVSYDFTIASADKAKPLNISFEYTPSIGTYVAGSDTVTGDFNVYIYDVTNSTLIQPTPYKLTGGTGTNWKYSGTFQTASNSTSYRFIIHTAGTTNSGITFTFDNVVIGPQIQVYGSPISDWTSFTPTGTWSASTTWTGMWRRVGDSMEVQATATLAGAPTGTFTLNLPSGYSIDTTKLSKGAVAGSTALGIAAAEDGGTGNHLGEVVYNSATVVRVQGDDGADLWNATVPITFGNTDFVNLRFMVPILGWGSNVVMSQDADTRVVAARYTSTSTAGITTTQTILNYDTVVQDTHGAVTTGASWKFTAPMPGFYEVTAQYLTSSALIANATDNWSLQIFKNGSADQALATEYAAAVSTRRLQVGGSAVLYLIAGDYIDLRHSVNTGATHSLAAYSTGNVTAMSVRRISGPATIAASELIACLYESNTARSISSAVATTGEFLMEDKVFDTHGAYSTSTAIFTVPAAGKYRVTAQCALASSAAWDRNEEADLRLYKNGSYYRMMGAFFGQVTNTLLSIAHGSTLVSCVAGDTLELRAFQNTGSAINTSGTATENWVAYERIGI